MTRNPDPVIVAFANRIAELHTENEEFRHSLLNAAATIDSFLEQHDTLNSNQHRLHQLIAAAAAIITEKSYTDPALTALVTESEILVLKVRPK